MINNPSLRCIVCCLLVVPNQMAIIAQSFHLWFVSMSATVSVKTQFQITEYIRIITMITSNFKALIWICWYETESVSKLSERLPFVPPLKKKLTFFFLTHFPSSIYFISYILLFLLMVLKITTNTDKHFPTSLCRESNSDHVASSPVSSSLPLHHARRAESSLSHNHIDNIKNSAISVIAGAIYMRSLASSRCYIWFTDGINRYQCNVNGRWITSITL